MSFDPTFIREEYLIQECTLLSVEQRNALIEADIISYPQLLSQDSHYIMEITFLTAKEYYKLREDVLLQCRPRVHDLVEMCILGSSRKPLQTGIEKLDMMLDGGLYGGEILEICGKSGTGKSQICMSIAAAVCRRKKGPSVVYIDLKNDFLPQRFHNLCQKDFESIKSIHVIRETKAKDIIDTLEQYEKSMVLSLTTFMESIEVFILDSVPVALYPCMTGKDDTSRIHQERLTQAFKRLATRFNAVIILTNNVVVKHFKKRREKGKKLEAPPPKLIPALGCYWRGVPNFRVLLEQIDPSDSTFQATLSKCARTTTSSYNTFDYKILEKGIE